MTEKRLVIVLDGSAAMGPYWRTIFSDYLEKIIRHFCGPSTTQKPSGQVVELGVVMYKTRGPYSGCLVQFSSWMRDMERFLECLLAFNFDGGGHDDAAIAEGLADALVMFPKPPNGDQTQQYLLGDRHCILVAASNPYPFPTPVLVPKIKDDQFCGAEADCCVADAKTVAGMFTQCSVSLSVISPKKFPKLEQLYNAGNGNDNHKGPDPSLFNVKNPHFLVLLSEKFLEARSALGEQEAGNTSSSTSAIKKESDSFASFSDFLFDPSEEEEIFLQQICDEPSMKQKKIPTANILTETSEVEAMTVCSEELPPGFSEYLCAPPHGFSTSIPSSKTASPSSNSHKKIIHDDKMVELHPRASSLSENKTFSSLTAGGSPQGQFTQAHQVMTSIGEAGENSQGKATMSIVKENPQETKTSMSIPQSAPNTCKVLCPTENASGSSHNFKPAGLGSLSAERKGQNQRNGPAGVTSEALAGTPESAQKTAGSIFTSSDSNIPGNFTISLPSRPKTVYAGIRRPPVSEFLISKSKALLGSSQTAPNTTGGPFTSSKSSNVSGNLRTVQPLSTFQRPIGHHDMQSRVGQGYPAGAHMEHTVVGCSSNQEGAFGQSSMSSSSGTSASTIEKVQRAGGVTEIFAPATDLEYRRGRYVIAWEGPLYAKYQGHIVLLSNIRAYMKRSATETLTANWPQSLRMDQVIGQNFINKIPYDGHADFLIFEAFTNHIIYKRLREREFCARINLPSQTLIFIPTDKEHRFIGTLFPGIFPQFNPERLVLQHGQQQNDQATPDGRGQQQSDQATPDGRAGRETNPVEL